MVGTSNLGSWNDHWSMFSINHLSIGVNVNEMSMFSINMY